MPIYAINNLSLVSISFSSISLDMNLNTVTCISTHPNVCFFKHYCGDQTWERSLDNLWNHLTNPHLPLYNWKHTHTHTHIVCFFLCNMSSRQQCSGSALSWKSLWVGGEPTDTCFLVWQHRLSILPPLPKCSFSLVCLSESAWVMKQTEEFHRKVGDCLHTYFH